MKVLFLDIDGVLNSRRSCIAFGGYPHEVTGHPRQMFDEVAVALIRGIVKQAGAKVVLSSSWRIVDDHGHIGQGLDMPIIDATPVLAGKRGEEIAAWLAAHPEVETYAIVDDDSDMLDGQLPHFIHTNHSDGFLWQHAQQMAEIFGIDLYDVNRAAKLGWEPA